jgi:hypothetical protein
MTGNMVTADGQIRFTGTAGQWSATITKRVLLNHGFYGHLSDKFIDGIIGVL